jgi:PAT family beta-lactamase induction signal transducer AmpG
MAVGLVAALLVKEPTQADAVMADKTKAARRMPMAAAWDAVAGPFIEFFTTRGVMVASLTLFLITTYHLSDYMRGPMSNPFYTALGIGKPTIAAVRATIGLGGSIAGIAMGGLSSLRLGNRSTLVLGAILQPIGIAAFAFLGWHGGDWTVANLGGAQVSAFAVIMAFDAFAIGFSGVGLVAYMSTLTSLGYTATQYALLTSALTWSGKTLKGFSGVIVDQLQQGRTLLEAYALFYLLCGVIGLPAILLCLFVPKPSVTGKVTALN